METIPDFRVRGNRDRIAYGGETSVTTAIWWIRRDLRLTDNQALSAALAYADEVLPTFILDPILLGSPYVGTKPLPFLLEGLRCLDSDLRARGSHLVLRRGHPWDELAELRVESGSEVIFAEEDHSPYARHRDAQVAETMPGQLVNGEAVHRF